MNFEQWWKLLKPAECDEVKSTFEECWQAGRESMREEVKARLQKFGFAEALYRLKELK